MAGGELLGAQRGVILDDAVVDDGTALAGEMRMRVLGGRLAVRRPAGVRDADMAVERFGGDRVDQLRDLAEVRSRRMPPSALSTARPAES
jgi:hypothetical protein